MKSHEVRVMNDEKMITSQQMAEILEYVTKHIDEFGSLPMCYKCSRGSLFNHDEIRDVAEQHGLNSCLSN